MIRVAPIMIAAAWVAVGCLLTAVTPTEAQESRSPVLVRALTVEGHRHFDEALILSRVRTEVGDPFDPSRLSEDLRAIFALGFFEDVGIRVEELEGGVEVTFIVVERPFVRDVVFRGNRRLDTAKLQESAELRLGRPLNPAQLARTRERLREAYEREGHFEARVTPRVEPFADGDVRVVVDIEEGRRLTIDRVRISGNRALDDRQIKRVLATREREYFVLRGVVRREEVDRDAERIVALYQDHGYLQARVDAHDLVIDRERARVTVTFRVTEGAQFRLGAIEVQGAESFPDSEVRGQLGFQPGDVFSRSEVRRSLQRITELYGVIGRTCADVRAVTSDDGPAGTVDLTIQVREGPEVYVDRIEISGNTRTAEHVIRRELGFAEGERLTSRKLDRAQQRLVNLQYFQRVEVSTRAHCPS